MKRYDLADDRSPVPSFPLNTLKDKLRNGWNLTLDEASSRFSQIFSHQQRHNFAFNLQVVCATKE